ncbi:MAG: sigma-70 family RNA polymerase sigma factor [Gammaproteobacteria bacterium]|nr:sigma-70 family RNA polymerase sigma factor [Gammaproteobacteria bacterium]
MTNGAAENVHAEIAALLPRLRRFARSLTRNVHDADDVVQVAVERALTHIAQRRRDTRLDGWLFKIVRNAWIDEIRFRKRRGEVCLADDTPSVVAAGALDEALSIRAAMSRLPEEQRLAVSLVLVEGLSYREAADVLDVPIGTLTSRLARGRQALQSVLQS